MISSVFVNFTSYLALQVVPIAIGIELKTYGY